VRRRIRCSCGQSFKTQFELHVHETSCPAYARKHPLAAAISLHRRMEGGGTVTGRITMDKEGDE
jgi:hypothetical protein